MANLPAGFTNIPDYTNYYFPVLNSDSGNPAAAGNDPGVAANLSDAKIAQSVNNLYKYLTNSTWPECPGTSIAKKYFGSDSDPRIFNWP